MAKTVASQLNVVLVADSGQWTMGMDKATASTRKFEAAARAAARAQAIDEISNPRKLTPNVTAENSIFAQQAKDSEQRRVLAINALNQAIENARERERQQAIATAAVVAESEAKKQAAIQHTAAVNARISQAMALQRGQVIADMTAGSGNQINAANSMFAQQAARATLETRKLWSAQVQAKVAANALAASLGASGGASGVSGGMRNMGNTTADSQKKLKHFQLAVQQGGYQLQDFIVQLAGGQNGFVAFGQQASQMAGFFGKSGAWAGVGLAIAGVAGMMLSNAAAAEKTTSRYKTLTEALDGYIDARRRLFLVGKEPSAELPALERDAQKLRAEQAAAEARAKQIREQQKKVAIDMRDRSQRDIFSTLFNIGRRAFSGNAKAQDLIAAEARAGALEPEIKAKEVINDLDKERRKNETEAYIAAAAAQKQALQERIEAGNAVFMAEEKAREERKKEADAIRDQIDPLRVRVREQERLNALVTKGALTQQELRRYNAGLSDKIAQSLQSRIPQALSVRGGGQSTGGFVGSTQNSAQTSIKLLQDMLSTLQRIAVGVN